MVTARRIANESAIVELAQAVRDHLRKSLDEHKFEIDRQLKSLMASTLSVDVLEQLGAAVRDYVNQQFTALEARLHITIDEKVSECVERIEKVLRGLPAPQVEVSVSAPQVNVEPRVVLEMPDREKEVIYDQSTGKAVIRERSV